jgi:hypothetical protein
MLALLCLIVLGLAGAVGPIELLVFVAPAFASGFWLTRRGLAGSG